jgi:hypothetical protein
MTVRGRFRQARQHCIDSQHDEAVLTLSNYLPECRPRERHAHGAWPAGSDRFCRLLADAAVRRAQQKRMGWHESQT